MKAKNEEIWRDRLLELGEQENKTERRKILKNVVLISLGFLFNFTAYSGLSKLQSSLHIDEGMGVVNQAVLYGTLVLACLFLPKIVLRFLGHKWTIPVMFIGYITWLAANGYGVWWTMTPASIIVGLCAAPLWTAQCSYFTLEAGRYSVLSKEKENDVLTRFFGIFFCFFQMSGVIGAIISSTILEQNTVNGSEVSPNNEILQFCGANDCPGNNVTNPNLEEPDSTLVWIMVGVYIGIAVVGVILLMMFVDQLPNYLRQQESKGKLKDEIKNLLFATFKHLRHVEQLLLIPLTIYSGLEQGFLGAEFYKSFVTCSIGIWNVGLVSIPFGVVNALVSFTSGSLVKYTGRVPLFLAGFFLHLSLQIFLLFWLPTPGQVYLLYLTSGLWGASDAIWQTLINALYGSLFSKESDAAFCNYRMWESIGFIIAFAYSSFLCTSVKLYVTLSGLIIGMIGYGIVEYRIRKSDMSVKEKKELKYEIKDLKSIKSKDPSSLVNGIDNKAFSTHM